MFFPEVLTVEDLHTIFREVSFLLAVRKRLGILWYWDVKTYNCFNIIDLAMLQSYTKTARKMSVCNTISKNEIHHVGKFFSSTQWLRNIS